MLKTMFRARRAYSLLEVLLTVSLLGLLLFVIAYAVSHALATTALDVGRNGIARSADELATRLASEARSSTAVFVPPTDVYGQPNDAAAGSREVDFFRKASDGTTAYVAYRYDASSGLVDRYDYQPVAGQAPTIIDEDAMADGVTSFMAAFHEASTLAGIVGASDVKPVHIYYGSPSWAGGNGIVSVSIVAGVSGGPQRHLEVHLASRAAPSEVAVLVSASSPPPSPGPTSSPLLVGFLLKAPLNHGPWHQGDPGYGLHGPGIAGTALFVGDGADVTVDWQSLYIFYNVVVNGSYNFVDSNGNKETVTISCDGSCPAFVPNPVATDGPTVIFHTVK